MKVGGGLRRDSLEKIVCVYLAGVCSEPFTFRGQEFHPKVITVSPGIFRGYTCPPRCGGCCPNFSLEYLPDEDRPEGTVGYTEEVNGREVVLYHDPQHDNSGHFCRHLDHDTGRCGIYSVRPFHCDFELIRFTHRKDGVHITTRLFGRGWSYLRVDGQRGARCEITPPDPVSIADVQRKLRRLRDWADHLRVATHLDTIIAWVDTGPHNYALRIDPRQPGVLARVAELPVL